MNGPLIGNCELFWTVCKFPSDSPMQLVIHKRLRSTGLGCRDGSVVQSACGSSGRWEFSSQHHIKQAVFNPSSGDVIPSSGLFKHMHTCGIHMYNI